MKDNIYLVRLSNGQSEAMFIMFFDKGKIALGFRTVKYSPNIKNKIKVEKNKNLYYNLGILYNEMYRIPNKCIGKLIGFVDKKTINTLLRKHGKINYYKDGFRYEDIPLTSEIRKKINYINKKITCCKINNENYEKLLDIKKELVNKLKYEYIEYEKKGKYHPFDGYREPINKNGVWIYGAGSYKHNK